MNKIIYPNSRGRITILTPTGEVPFDIVCQKDVPSGVPYKIVSEDQIPTDRSFRNAWEVDFSEPDGYGGDYGIGTNLAVIGYDDDNNPIKEERGHIQ